MPAKTNPSAERALPNVPSPAETVDQLEELEKRLNVLLPLVNNAQLAFGGQEAIQSKVADLKNRIAQAKAVYKNA